MATIRRNWTKRIAAVRAAAKYCRAYDSSTGNMINIDPARAFEVWEANPRATLYEDTPGQKWTVHVHSNSFYILTTTDPEQDHQQRQKTATAAPVPAPGRPVRTSREEAVIQEAREYIQDAPGIGARTAAAATAAIGQKVRAGALIPNHLTGALPRITAAVTAKTVAEMRAQNLTHEQIRQRFERKKAEAEHSGNAKRAAVADAMLTVHAGIAADEEAQARPALPAPTPELEPATAPATYAGVPVPAPVRDRWGSELADGWRLGVRAANAHS
ncbi:hypothetical protein ABZ820_12660 [Streptomyces diacarni]|uniref:hypothetical protein n=1 Tax=Streptomyces diacarni TaxID=2800381 RepID=UPI0033DB074D